MRYFVQIKFPKSIILYMLINRDDRLVCFFIRVLMGFFGVIYS